MTVDDMKRIKDEYFPWEKDTPLKEFLEHGGYSKEINIIINQPGERERLFPQIKFKQTPYELHPLEILVLDLLNRKDTP